MTIDNVCLIITASAKKRNILIDIKAEWAVRVCMRCPLNGCVHNDDLTSKDTRILRRIYQKVIE